MTRLWVACALAGQALAAAPFSHQTHLKLKLECTSCHSSVRTSIRVEDNNLPPVSACAGCHKDAVIPQPPVTLLARFNHQKHVAFGDISPVIRAAIKAKTYFGPAVNVESNCGACHRGMNVSTVVSKVNLPQMADCLVCHTEIDPPFSCEFCHAKGAKLKPVSHVTDFVDTHSRKAVEKVGCAICHGRKFTCLGCH